MIGKSDENNNMMLNLVAPLSSQVEISYVTYGIYTDDNVRLYSSFKPLLQSWLDDEYSQLPHQVSNKTTILEWKKYCSESFLSSSKSNFNLNSNGTTIYFQHKNHAEHIALASNSNTDILKILLEKPELKNHIIHHIRNNINLNKSDFDAFAHDHCIKDTIAMGPSHFGQKK